MKDRKRNVGRNREKEIMKRRKKEKKKEKKACI